MILLVFTIMQIRSNLAIFQMLIKEFDNMIQIRNDIANQYIIMQVNQFKALSEQIEIHPFVSNNYLARSQIFEQKGQYQSALLDLSKSIILQPTPQNYLIRSNLFTKSNQFSLALQDLQDAKYLLQTTKQNQIKQNQPERFQQQKNKQELKRLQELFEHSVCIKNLPKFKEIVTDYQAVEAKLPEEEKKNITNLLVNLISMEQFLANKIIKMDTKYQKQIAQFQQLLQLQQKKIATQEGEIITLKNERKYYTKNFQNIFLEEIQSTTFSTQNKEKCIIYFHTLCSEMEKYYLAAKTLQQFSPQHVSFEDLAGQQITKESQLLKKIFREIGKHAQKAQRLEQVIKVIPYVGTMFKFIKTIAKGSKLLDQMKQKNQCANILLMAPTLISFNSFSTQLAYNLYKTYRFMITTTTPKGNHQRSSWQNLKKKYVSDPVKKYVAQEMCPHLLQQQLQTIREIGQIHAGIIMVAFGHGKLKIKDKIDEQFMIQVHSIINDMNQRIRTKNEINNQLNEAKKNLDWKCIIF